jgi:2-methylcitrate dehydratase PrpD
VPDRVLKTAKLSILDAIGTALLSSGLEKSKRTARAVKSASSGGRTTAWGFGFRASALESALLNGMLIEGLDYSDIHVGAGLHPTSVILPAVASYGELKHASGGRVLISHVLGCETMIRLGLSAPGRFHARGFQPTSLTGVVGAAVAASKMMGLPKRGTEEAMSLGSTLAFGSSLSVRVGACFGGVDSGMAAESGLLAALLAREGIEGIARDSIEGRFGFMDAHAGPGNYDLGPVTKGLGKTWETAHIFLKRYPTSYACTPMLDAALRLRRRSKLRAGEREEIRFGDTAPNIGLFSEPEQVKRRPTNIYDAKTSHYFLLALALGYGEVMPADLAAKLADPKVQELSDRVRYSLDEKSHWVEVRTKDGRVLRETQDSLVPTPEREVRRKFSENASAVVGAKRSDEIEAMVDALEELPDIVQLTRLLGTGRRSQA